MKLKKKWKASLGAVLAAGVLTLSLAGCGDDNVSQVGQAAAAQMSPGDILSASKQASQANHEQDVQAKMNAVMKISGTDGSESHEINLNLDADLIAHQSPMKMSMNMSMDMAMDGERESQDMDMYMIQENDKMAMYMNMDGQWMKQVIALDSEQVEELKASSTRSFDTDAFTDAFQSDSQVLTNKGITKINGKDAVLLEGELSFEDMEDALKSAGIEDQLRQLNLTLSDIKPTTGIQVAAYYDPVTYMPLQMDIDLTDFCAELFDALLKNTLSSTNETIKVDQYTMSIQMVAYGKDVPEVVLPAAAAAAQTVSE